MSVSSSANIEKSLPGPIGLRTRETRTTGVNPAPAGGSASGHKVLSTFVQL